jgi:FPC/CPF motif-containing protein YcgG
MTTPVVGNLVAQSTVAERVDAGDSPEWVAEHWRTFEASLTGTHGGEPFPCYFGADSIQEGEPLYTAVPSMTDPDALLSLGDTLLAYLDRYRDHADRASLVAFFAPPAEPLGEAEYHEHLWHVLQFLHVHDPEPWPADIPTDPDDPRWEFSFGGEPMFPTCRAPFYDERQSRYSPVGLEITFQPRALFENLGVTADTERGQAARELIQERLEAYDGVPPHPKLGDWGIEGDREWPQYMFADDESQAPDECPIAVSREHPKATVLAGE